MSKVYIGLEDAIEVISKYEDYKGYLQGDYEQILREQVEPADVKPIVRGEWEEYDDWNDSNIYRCSNCGSEFILEAGTPKENDYNFCPNCGADMRERSKK